MFTLTPALRKAHRLHSFVRSRRGSDPDVQASLVAGGMIQKRDLQDGRWYSGWSRSTVRARWDAAEQCFEFAAKRFPHPEDDDGRDVFVPVED